MNTTAIPRFEGQPGEDGPAFAEVWEAQAFAMVIALHERGVFNWSDWATTLSEEIRAAQARGDPDLGTTYYHHWLNALERIVVAKGLATKANLTETSHAWLHAANETPHGQPIQLERHRRT